MAKLKLVKILLYINLKMVLLFKTLPPLNVLEDCASTLVL
nr:MAG TPA: hypothetical protein [Caudoviricetes sp.]